MKIELTDYDRQQFEHFQSEKLKLEERRQHAEERLNEKNVKRFKKFSSRRLEFGG